MKLLPELMTRKPKPEEPPSYERLRAVKSAAVRLYGLKIDAAKMLDAGEQVELVELYQGLKWEDGDGEGGVALGQLTEKETTRWEQLLGKAAGDPDVLPRRRDEAAKTRQLGELVRRAMRPGPRPRYEEVGSISLPASVFAAMARPRPAYRLSHLGLLAAMLGMFENGESLFSNSHFETDEDGAQVLVLHSVRSGLGALEEADRGIAWQKRLAHLCKNGWFVAQKGKGGEVRIRLGARALAVRKGRSS